MRNYILIGFLLIGQLVFGQTNKDIDLDAFNSAVWFQTKGDYQGSIERFDNFIMYYPGYWRAHFYRGYGHFSLKNYDKALFDFQRVCELNKEEAKPLYYVGKTYFMMGEYENAISYFNKALGIQPDYAEAHNDKGMAYYRQGQFDIAIESFQEATRIDPKFAMAYNNAGSARFFNQDIANPARRDIEAARGFFSKAIDADRKLFIAWYNRACMNFFLKNYDDALSDIENARLIQPQNAMTYFYSGVCYGRKGNYIKGLADLEQALKLAPKLSYPYEEVGRILKEQKEYDGSIQAYEKALSFSRLEIYDGLMYYQMAKVYALQEDETMLYRSLKAAKSKGVFKDLKVYQEFLKAKEFKKYRYKKPFQKFTKSVKRGKKVNKFTDSELAWFRLGN